MDEDLCLVPAQEREYGAVPLRAERTDFAEQAVTGVGEEAFEQLPADAAALEGRLDAQGELGHRPVGEPPELAEPDELRVDERTDRKARLGQVRGRAGSEEAGSAGFAVEALEVGEPGGPVPRVETAEPDRAGPEKARHRRSDPCASQQIYCDAASQWRKGPPGSSPTAGVPDRAAVNVSLGVFGHPPAGPT